MKNFISVILARGGSKRIPNKNITDFCGKPLIAWTIEQCFESGIERVYISSDCKRILEIGFDFGGIPLLRPKGISGDQSTSEEGWKNAIEQVAKRGEEYDWIVAPQITSPIRTSTDLKNGMLLAQSSRYDSIFSCSPTQDLCLWKVDQNGIDSINFDWQNRKRSQENQTQYIENGSFYIFRPKNLVKYNNRLWGNIGMSKMKFWQMFEIDSQYDLKLCSVIMNEFILK